ncbi:cyclic-di-AMP-binding protein CbpB [Metabacillus arenae]|uniref:CBS domain-containing protein n=1 Tax=Metabacillus arenae TaxID=2771434 RepID=A0A926ND43_9BACI|nr:cyclic-di-AMP-binding protein CbpB [Metabacillus arenae]MBD1381284.1 CBS domain-containing protein [Metabacillus arenae]
MISLRAEELLDTTIHSLIIPGDKVAHVNVKNNLEHALLVLTKTGYTAIPVLDSAFKLCGLIGTNMIMDSILGLERIEFEKLEEIKVEEVMNSEIPRLKLTDSASKALDLSIDHPFICVENEEGTFEGIFTRRVILKQLKSHMNKLNK